MEKDEPKERRKEIRRKEGKKERRRIRRKAKDVARGGEGLDHLDFRDNDHLGIFNSRLGTGLREARVKSSCSFVDRNRTTRPRRWTLLLFFYCFLGCQEYTTRFRNSSTISSFPAGWLLLRESLKSYSEVCSFLGTETFIPLI